MNELDLKIHDLFINLVNSKTEYLNKIDYGSRSLIYKIDNNKITLKAYTKSDKVKHKENSFSDTTSLFRNCISYSWDILWCDPNNGVDFIIDINDKYYEVNGLSRVEYAMSLDALDETIRTFEDSQLEGVFTALSTYDEIL